jgi:hypothetical protein
MDEIGDDVEVKTVVIIVELQDGEMTTIRYRCNDMRQWVQRAMLREALDVASDPSDEYDDT